MRQLLTACAVVAALCLATLAAFAQTRGSQATFDPRDLSGYWLRNAVRPRNAPTLTPAGVEAMKGRVPNPKVRTPSETNDPMYACNPQGFPRLAWEENEPIEFIMLPDRVLQLFQWERTMRELWLDGRELPRGERLENLGPAWYGHSVAEERYTRTGPDAIEGRLTINDPKIFTTPWVHPTSTFRRMAENDITFYGWRGVFSGITEAIYAPMNEVDDFNRRMRDPAARGK
jgi:hypothetical protein